MKHSISPLHAATLFVMLWTCPNKFFSSHQNLHEELCFIAKRIANGSLGLHKSRHLALELLSSVNQDPIGLYKALDEAFIEVQGGNIYNNSGTLLLMP